MKPYLISLAVGSLVGIIYSLFNVRSPAPPVIALIGLLGMLIGEQIPPLVKHVLVRQTTTTTWVDKQVKPHVFGKLPCGQIPEDASVDGARLNNGEKS